VVGNLRQGFNLSDLDVGTNDDGTLAVRAGTYISENVYTGVEVGADGTAEVNINLDLTPNLKARGAVGTDGNTTLGIYFEKDY
jgi:translocation and assembly module TamB